MLSVVHLHASSEGFLVWFPCPCVRLIVSFIGLVAYRTHQTMLRYDVRSVALT